MAEVKQHLFIVKSQVPLEGVYTVYI